MEPSTRISTLLCCKYKYWYHKSGTSTSTYFKKKYLLVGKLFIDIADIYCFGTGLPISRSKHVFQYRHFK